LGWYIYYRVYSFTRYTWYILVIIIVLKYYTNIVENIAWKEFAFSKFEQLLHFIMLLNNSILIDLIGYVISVKMTSFSTYFDLGLYFFEVQNFFFCYFLSDMPNRFLLKNIKLMYICFSKIDKCYYKKQIKSVFLIKLRSDFCFWDFWTHALGAKSYKQFTTVVTY